MSTGDPTWMWGFVVVAHSDRRCVGQRTLIHPGQRVDVGRGSSVFGEGVLDDSRVSRRHAVIIQRDDRLFLLDAGSHNGVRINGQRLRQPTTTLAADDVVQIGGALLMAKRVRWPAMPPSSPHVVAYGDAMAAVLRRVVARTVQHQPILLWGEPATGASSIAREVHRLGRETGRLAVVRGSAGGSVVESQLFGDPQRLYFGAQSAAGLIADSGVGTLFIDDLDQLAPPILEALASALAEAEGRPRRRFVGFVSRSSSRTDLPVALLRWLRAPGIELPPLRSRREDVPQLAQRIVERLAGGPGMSLGRQLCVLLARYSWPGNLRELEQLMQRMVAEAGSQSVLDIPPWLRSHVVRAAARHGAVRS